MSKKKWCKVRHKIWFAVMQPIFSIVLFNKYRYKANKYKLDKKQNYLIICNHSCSLDPFMVSKSFNRPVYYIASDDLMKNKFASFWMSHAVAPIPIRKGSLDLSCIKRCISVAKEGGTIGLFPEGNRTYSGEISYIEKSIVKLIKKLDIPLVLYHIDGGYGIDPRWGRKPRKAKGSTGYVDKIISTEEIKKYSDDELYEIIVKSLGKESSSELVYKSSNRAEYLERVLFVCPKCHSLESMFSFNNTVKCSNCSFEAKYNEHLFFESKDEAIKIKNVKEWCEFQKEFIKDYEFKDNTILLNDKDVYVILSKTNEKKQIIGKGNLEMYSDKFLINGDKQLVFRFEDITQVVNQGKHKLLFYIGDDYYQFKGDERFSSYKYYLMYHKIDNTLDKTL